ncbi:MAG: NgoPII family restriction endonuclease [Nitrosarchaeum sp.]|nr:NgoPII family restriction endonuclease [Nitrosarchaeum sp.]
MNHLVAICNVAECKDFTLKKNDEFIPNYVSAEGKPLEVFVRALFCGIPGKKESFVRPEKVFSYMGSSNNPPDAMIISGGDAIETKKVETQKTDIVLNSSLPKTMIFASDRMVNSKARACEQWESRDLLYVVGHVPKNERRVKSLFFFYGDCYAKKNEYYKEKFNEIKARVTSTGEISPDGNEYGTLKNVDGLGNGVYMRVRPINGMYSPWKIFKKYVDLGENSQFLMVSVMRKSKYESFPAKDRERLEKSQVEKKEIKIVDPDNPDKKVNAVLIKYQIS